MAGGQYRLSWVIASAICLCMTLPSSAADNGREKITIIVSGSEKQIYLPVVLAQRIGYFNKAGLDIELINSRAGVEAEDELLAGAVQGVVGYYDHTIDLQAKGKRVYSIVQLAQSPGEVELVAARVGPDVASLSRLKGRTLGVTGLGSSTDFLTRYICARAGLGRADYTVLPVGSGDSFIAAMTEGRVDAGMTTEPTAERLLRTGAARVLIDLRTPQATRRALGDIYPSASLYVQPEWVSEHEVTAQKLANALVEVLHYIASHSAQEITDKMPKDYLAGDREAYVKTLAEEKEMFTRDGRMPTDGPAAVLKVLEYAMPSMRRHALDLSATFTTKFVDAARPLTR